MKLRFVANWSLVSLLRCYVATVLRLPSVSLPGPKPRHVTHTDPRSLHFEPHENSENAVNMQSPGPLGPSKSNLLVPKTSSESASFSFSAILGSFGLFWTPPKTRARAAVSPFLSILSEKRVPRTRVLTPRKHVFQTRATFFSGNQAISPHLADKLVEIISLKRKIKFFYAFPQKSKPRILRVPGTFFIENCGQMQENNEF